MQRLSSVYFPSILQPLSMPDFFIHSCCADLPSKIKHPLHQEHAFHLFPKAPNSLFFCSICCRPCNGFAYSCDTCDGLAMDVVCALLPPSVTHESHGKTHILYMSHDDLTTQRLSCGDQSLGVFFECSNCSHFSLHAKCALLPRSIRHKYDEHPLMLTTTSGKLATTDDGEVQLFWEICELGIHQREWHYSCNLCDQSFHSDCIPSVDRLSRIKFGVTIRVNCHACRLTLVREDTVVGYRCDYCRETIRREWQYECWAYECSECCFRIHGKCAEECLLESG